MVLYSVGAGYNYKTDEHFVFMSINRSGQH